jgi:hypothetical protein
MANRFTTLHNKTPFFKIWKLNLRPLLTSTLQIIYGYHFLCLCTLNFALIITWYITLSVLYQHCHRTILFCSISKRGWRLELYLKDRFLQLLENSTLPTTLWQLPCLHDASPLLCSGSSPKALPLRSSSQFFFLLFLWREDAASFWRRADCHGTIIIPFHF